MLQMHWTAVLSMAVLDCTKRNAEARRQEEHAPKMGK
jgi:hypothetical protein